MARSSKRPEHESEVDEETRRIILERLATADEEAKAAVDARETIEKIRENLLKRPVLR